jgi:membrane-bound lytic murein transglycosylase B
LLKNNTISNFFNNLNNIKVTQENLQSSIQYIRNLRSDLELQQETLENKKADFERLRNLEEVEKRSLAQNKYSKDKLLSDTKGEEAKFQALVKKSESDIEAIRKQIYYLEQHGISAEEAIKYGQLAALRAGIRPAFLIAILEIESGLGRNVGSGNWKDDMYECYIRLGTIYYPNRKDHYFKRAETEKNAFFAIVEKLGLDPDTVKVSKEPNYGCGGAMGPAQFIPSTWLSYEDRVSKLTDNYPPDPWNIEDAFMASAIKLADGGATSQTRSGESRAARAYIGGKTTCSSSICNYYSNAVLRKASEIEANL